MYIIHDCDPALFKYIRDVDDSLALGYELRKFTDEVLLVGVTTVYGNDSIENTYKTAIRIVRKSGRDIPVKKGAESSNDLGIQTEAVKFILESARKYGSIVILATGPLTNIASALIIYGELADMIDRIIIMGGAVYTSGNVPIVGAEFNFWKDPMAVRIVLEKIKDITLTPLDLTKKVKWGKEIVEELSSKKDELAEYLSEGIRKWAKLWSLFGGFHPHDVLASVYLTRPEIYSSKKDRILVDDKGRVKVSDKGKLVNILIDVDKEEFFREYVSAFE